MAGYSNLVLLRLKLNNPQYYRDDYINFLF